MEPVEAVVRLEGAERIGQARKTLETFRKWFHGHVEPYWKPRSPHEVSKWQRELSAVTDLLERPQRVRIALVGTTGAGKSTFLNAVLEQELLPVGVMQPCTAFVTTVTHSETSVYSLTVKFCTREEWQSDLQRIAAALRPGENDGEAEGRREAKRVVEAARKRVQAVYGEVPESEAAWSGLLERALPEQVEGVLDSGSIVKQSFPDAKAMTAYLKSLVRGESPLWPLIKEVSIDGPYECLVGGLELVDLPGLNDPNEARVEVTREYLRTAPFVWVMFSMVRGLTDDIQRILGEERLFRQLVLSGTYDALSLIGTKADDIDVNVSDQLGLPEDCPTEELVAAYREQTALAVRRQLEEMVRDVTGGDEADSTVRRMIALVRNVRVHTTSASAYIKIRHIARLKKDYGIDDEQPPASPKCMRTLQK